MIEEVKYSDFVQHTSSDPKVAPVTAQKVGRTAQPNSLWRARGKIATPDFMVIYAPHDQVQDIMEYVMYDERFKDNNVMDCGAHSPYVTPEMLFCLIKEKHPYAIFYYKYVIDLYPEVHGSRSSRKTDANETQYHLAPAVIKGHWQKIEWHRAENSYFKEVPSDQYDKVLAELTIGLTNEEGRVSECFQDMYVDAEALYKVEWVKGSVLYMKEIPEYMPEPYQDVIRDFEGVGEWKGKKIEGLTPKITDYQNEGDMFSVYSRFWYAQSERFADNDALLDYNNTQQMVRRDNHNPLMIIAGDKDQIMDCIHRQIELAVKAKVSQADIDAEYETKANIEETTEPDGLTVAPSMKAPRVKGLQAVSISQAAEYDTPAVFDAKTAVSGIVYDGALDEVFMDLESNKKVFRFVIRNSIQYDDELLFGWNQDEGRAFRALYPSILSLYRVLGDGTSDNPFVQYGDPTTARHAANDYPFLCPAVNFEHDKRGYFIGRAGGKELLPLIPKDPYFGEYFFFPGDDYEGKNEENGPFHYVVVLGYDEKAGSYNGAFFLHNGRNIGKFVPQFNDWENRPASAKQVFDKDDGTALMNFVCDSTRADPARTELTTHMNEYLDQERQHLAETLDNKNSKVSMNNEEGQDDETMTEEKELVFNKEFDLDQSELQSALLQESGQEAAGSMGTHAPEADLLHNLNTSLNPFMSGITDSFGMAPFSTPKEKVSRSRTTHFTPADDAAITMGQAPDGYVFTTKMYNVSDWTANSHVMTVPTVPNPRDPATHFAAGITFAIDIQDYDNVSHTASKANTPFTILEKNKFTRGKDHFISFQRFNKKPGFGLKTMGWHIDNKRIPGQNFPGVKDWPIPGSGIVSQPTVKDLMIQLMKYDTRGRRTEEWSHLEPAPYAESRITGTTISMDKTATKAIKCRDIWIYQRDSDHAGYILLIGQYHFDHLETITFKPAPKGIDASQGTTMTFPNGDVWPYFMDHFSGFPISYVIAGHVNAAGNLTDQGAPIQLENL
jgi:hypothetical protein